MNLYEEYAGCQSNSLPLSKKQTAQTSDLLFYEGK